MHFSDDKANVSVQILLYLVEMFKNLCLQKDRMIQRICTFFFLISTLPLFKLHSPHIMLIRLAEGPAGGSKQRGGKRKKQQQLYLKTGQGSQNQQTRPQIIFKSSFCYKSSEITCHKGRSLHLLPLYSLNNFLT